MAAEEGFLVVLSGDSSPLEKAATDGAKSLDKVDKAADSTEKSLSGVVNVSKQVSAAAQQVAKSADTAGGSLMKASNSGTAFNKTLGGLQAQLRNFQQGLLTATNPESFNRINRAIEATKSRIDTLGKIGDPFSKLTKGGGDATQTLINVSRVAQDAPYGFMGIANNLNPLLESFQRLKVETGSTKQAFASLLSGLAGPAGIGLALGVVSSLLVTFGSKLFSSSKDADELAESIKAVGERSKEAAKQVQDLQNQLQFATQFEGLRIELGGGKSSKVLKKELELTKETADRITKAYKKEYDRNLYEETNYFQLSDDLKKEAEKSIQEHVEALAKLRGEQSDISKKQGILDLQIQLAEQKELKEINDKIAEDRDKANKKLKEQLEEAARLRYEFVKNMRVTEIEVTPPDVYFSKLPEIKNAYSANKDFEKFVQSKFEGIQINIPFKVVPEGEGMFDSKGFDAFIKDGTDSFKSRMEGFAEQARALVEQTTENLAMSFGEGIGQALAGGSFGNMFASLGNIVGDFIQQLGKYLITAAIKVEAFKKAFSSIIGNPALALSIGIGLVAIGAALKKSIPQPKAFAQGGLAFGTTMGLVGEGRGTSRANPEVIAPLDKLENFLGNNDGQFPDYLPVIQLSFDQLRVMYERANKQGGLF